MVFLIVFLLLAFPLTPKDFKTDLPHLEFSLLSQLNLEIRTKSTFCFLKTTAFLKVEKYANLIAALQKLWESC